MWLVGCQSCLSLVYTKGPWGPFCLVVPASTFGRPLCLVCPSSCLIPAITPNPANHSQGLILASFMLVIATLLLSGAGSVHVHLPQSIYARPLHPPSFIIQLTALHLISIRQAEWRWQKFLLIICSMCVAEISPSFNCSSRLFLLPHLPITSPSCC